jgi:hypothetical protein
MMMSCEKYVISPNVLFICCSHALRYTTQLTNATYPKELCAELVSNIQLRPPSLSAGRRSAAVRMVLLVVLAWLTSLIFNAALLVVPVLVGRALLFAIPQLPVAGALKSNGNDCTPQFTRLALWTKFIC